MKLPTQQVATFVLSAAVVQASTLKQLEAQVKKNMPSDRPEELRALTESSMGLLANYGCWCYFETAHGQGRGRPVDTLDNMCQQLHQGYECILLDMNDAGTPCVPWEEPFIAVAGFGLTENDVIVQCETNNPLGSCAAHSCKVEGWFVQQYLTYTLNGGAINNSMRHSNGFDINMQCPISAGVKSDKQCCGTFPSRFSFKDYDGARDCCNGATFNTLMFSCCNDGTIRALCN